MSFVATRTQLRSADPGFLVQTAFELDARAGRQGLGALSPDDRYRLIEGVRALPDEVLGQLSFCDDDTRSQLAQLRVNGISTYARVGAVLLEQHLKREHEFRTLPREPLTDAPAVVFVANMGAQVPVSGPTLGNELRQIHGLQPPLGQCYVASFLSLLGAETYVFNLALGALELAELNRTLETLGDRVWCLSFASNFLGAGELDATHALWESLAPARSAGLHARFVAGGMGSFFGRETYLQYTPLEIVIGRYGEPSFGDLLFESSFEGPRDQRDSITLFGSIPNLHIAVDTPAGRRIQSTRPQRLMRSERRVFAAGLDVGKMHLREKYWSTGYVMGICAPDDLNIPVELATSGSSSNSDATPRPSPPPANTGSTSPELHLANYVFRPKTVKVMSTFGNCPRGCKFCQYTAFDEQIFFVSAAEAVAHYNQVVEALPRDADVRYR